MTDENDQVPQDSASVDGTVSTNNPHPVDEDPEDHIGDETPDPWDKPGWRAEYNEQNQEDNA